MKTLWRINCFISFLCNLHNSKTLEISSDCQMVQVQSVVTPIDPSNSKLQLLRLGQVSDPENLSISWNAMHKLYVNHDFTRHGINCAQQRTYRKRNPPTVSPCPSKTSKLDPRHPFSHWIASAWGIKFEAHRHGKHLQHRNQIRHQNHRLNAYSVISGIGGRC